jgi:hypothetical protein
MFKSFKHVAVFSLLIVSLLLSSGCRTAPIRNIENSPVITSSQAYPDMQKIGDAIIKAGAKLGWRMTVEEVGLITGKLFVRTHRAEVKIVFNDKSYSIIYKDSQNLKYDAEKSKIHHQYNNWVVNLDNAIRRELADMK